MPLLNGDASLDGDASPPRAEGIPRRAPRAYYLDWMRVLAIYLVVAYHTAQGLGMVGFWCRWQQQQVIVYRAGSLQIGMPMFFYISGRAQAFSKIGNIGQVITTRAVRLLLPLLICWFILCPTWHWVDSRDASNETCLPYQGCTLKPYIANLTCFTRTDSSEGLYPRNLVVFWWKFYTGQILLEKMRDGQSFLQALGSTTPDVAWLWFLGILFIVTVINTPLFMYMDRRSRRDRGSRQSLCLCIASWVFQWLMSWIFLKGYSWKFGFFLGLPSLSAIFAVQKVHMPDRTLRETTIDGASTFQHRNAKLARYWATQGILICHMVSTVGATVSFSYEEMDGITGYSYSAVRAVPQMFLYSFFYTQGFCAQALRQDHSVEDSDRHTDGGEQDKASYYIKIYQIITIIFSLLVMFSGSPIDDWEFASFPVYSESFHDGGDLFPSTYVLVTWVWIAIFDKLFQAYADQAFNEDLHKHASASTIIVYIFHWVFIKPFVFFIVRDLHLDVGLWRYIIPLLTFGIATLGSLGIYKLLLKYPKVGRVLGV
jgi:hypothetical protein